VKVFLILSAILLFTLGCKKQAPYISNENNKTFSLNNVDNISYTKDNGLIISGSFNGKYTLVKTDADLNVEWTKNNYDWGSLYSGSGWGAAFYSFTMKRIFQTANGNYVCIGAITQGGDVVFSSAFIVILNKNGEQIQKYSFDNTYLLNALQINNGYVLFGTQLTKLDNNFNQLWTKDIYNNGTYFPSQVISTTDGGLAITGSYNGDQIFLKKFDANGNILFTQTYKHNDYPFNEAGFDIAQLANNNFLIVGRTRETDDPYTINCQIIRTNSVGDTVWTKRFGYTANNWIENIVSYKQDEFVLQGSIGFPTDSVRNTVLININSNGDILNSKITEKLPMIVYCSPLNLYIKVQNNGTTMDLSTIKPDNLFD
jgi:hypothetical protein